MPKLAILSKIAFIIILLSICLALIILNFGGFLGAQDASVSKINSLPADKNFGGFKNVIKDSGIKQLPKSVSANWFDLDQDGWEDLLISGNQSSTRLYRNNRDGTFQDVTAKSKTLFEKKTSWGAAVGDYDNDGCSDIYLSSARGDYAQKKNYGGLYRNNCDGSFTDVTETSGIYDSYNGRGAAWADYNGDGFLDLYRANHGQISNSEYVSEPNVLYRNNGNGTFTNTTAKAMVEGVPFCPNIREGRLKDPYRKTIGYYKQSFQPIWFDYNNDGKIDLFVTNDSTVSPLYKNNGDGTFTDVTYEAGLCQTGAAMGVTSGDFDNDGDQDLYVTNTGSNYFWMNSGNGEFEEVAGRNGTSDDLSLGWGAQFFDYDNNGLLDLYSVNGRILGQVIYNGAKIGEDWLDRLYRNNADGTFSDIAHESKIRGHFPKEAAAFADYNNDGFTDILVLSSYLESKGTIRLYKNQGNTNNWLTLRLIGSVSNRDAIGAKIALRAGGITQTREIQAGSSYLSRNSLQQTFGLGLLNLIDEIIISWPSGITQTLKDIKPNQKITITEQP